MKKLLLILIIVAAFTESSYGMKELAGEFQPWDENCQVEGNTLNFLGEWNGVTFKFYDEENCVYEGGTDLSGYDVIVIKMSYVSCMFKIKTEYIDGGVQQNAWETEAVAQPGALIVAVPLNPEHKDVVKDFFIQNAKYPGSMSIDKIYACTTAEYEQLLNDSHPSSFHLTLKKIDEGGGSNYNPETHTLTIQESGSHRGWFFDGEFRDFSAFELFVIEFEDNCTSDGEIGIEYDDQTSSSVTFEAGTTRVVVPLTSSKDKLRQVYVKGDAGSSYILTGAYFSTNSAITSAKTVPQDIMETVISDNERQVYYSIDGKHATRTDKGLYIKMTGKTSQKVYMK